MLLWVRNHLVGSISDSLFLHRVGNAPPGLSDMRSNYLRVHVSAPGLPLLGVLLSFVSGLWLKFLLPVFFRV